MSDVNQFTDFFNVYTDFPAYVTEINQIVKAHYRPATFDLFYQAHLWKYQNLVYAAMSMLMRLLRTFHMYLQDRNCPIKGWVSTISVNHIKLLIFI